MIIKSFLHIPLLQLNATKNIYKKCNKFMNSKLLRSNISSNRKAPQDFMKRTLLLGMMDPLTCQSPEKALSEWDFIVAKTEEKAQYIN